MTTQTLNQSVAAEIRAELARQHLTQRGLVIMASWSEAYLSRRMNGDVAFSTSDLEYIASALRIPVSTLTSPRATSDE